METQNALAVLLRKFGKWFTFSVLGIFSISISGHFLSMYFAKPFALPLYILVIGIVGTLHTAFLLHKATFDFRTIYGFILFLLIIFITYVCLVLCTIDHTIFLLFLPLVTMMLLLTDIKKAGMFSVFIIILCFFLESISCYLKIGVPADFYKNNESLLLIQQYFVILISVYFSFLILHFYREIEKVKEQMKYKTKEIFPYHETENPSEQQEQEQQEDHKEKYRKLYGSIIEIFQKDKVYKDPNFNIRKLADLLDSNTTYVSKAMNIEGSKKFNQLINEYRINDVLNMMKSENARKYTIEHIYTQAGFSQQSTFNRIFKEYTGETPSEYLEKLKNR